MSEQRERTATAAPPETEVRTTPDRTLRGRIRRVRNRIRERPRLNLAWRIGVGVLGTLVLVLGVIAIPYPGPGWLIVFAGSASWPASSPGRSGCCGFLRRYYDQWSAWVRRQNVVVKLVLAALTGLVVVATVWLLGGFGLVAGWVGLEQWTWLQSPILG